MPCFYNLVVGLVEFLFCYLVLCFVILVYSFNELSFRFFFVLLLVFVPSTGCHPTVFFNIIVRVLNLFGLRLSAMLFSEVFYDFLFCFSFYQG